MHASEKILEAIDIIINERLDALKFDTTEICTVVEWYDETLNSYKIKYNNINFIAKATDDTKYTKDDKVFVLFPKGDINAANKVITGRCVTEEDAKKVWINPLDRVLDCINLPVEGKLQYVSNPIENNTELIIDITTDTWKQFINASALGAFDFIGVKANVYSYLGMIEEIPTAPVPFWFQIQLCNDEGQPLHGLVNDEISPLFFSSEDIDGDPYSQTIGNNEYQKIWNFPKDEILDPKQISQIKILFNWDNEVQLGEDSDHIVGIYFDNISLAFSYDLDRYKDKEILLTIPYEDQRLQAGYISTDTPPDIAAWVIYEEPKRLLHSDDINFTNIEPFINDVMPLESVPRYVSYEDQLKWLVEIFDHEDDQRLSFIADRLNLLRENQKQYGINQSALDAAEALYNDMVTCCNTLYQDYREDYEGTFGAEGSESQESIQEFFATYEKLFDTLLKDLRHYVVYWYKYQFGALKTETDDIVGSYWVPIKANGDYISSMALTGNQYSFSPDVDTQIQAVLCQRRYITESTNSNVYYTTSQIEALEKQTISFRNAQFDVAAMVKNEYLKIAGNDYLSIYDYNNKLYTAHVDNNYNKISVDFIDDNAKAEMRLTAGELVTWELLNIANNQIEKLDITDNCFTEKLRDVWYNHLFTEKTSEDFGDEYSAIDVDDYNKMAQDLKANGINYCDPNNILEAFSSDKENNGEMLPLIMEYLYTPIIEYLNNYISLFNTSTSQSIIERCNKRGLLFGTLASFKNMTNKLFTLPEWDILASTSTRLVILYDEDNKENWNTISFTPKEDFDINNNRSIIRCTIKGVSVDFPITFSLMGTQGTDYIFTIEPVIDEGKVYRGLANQRGSTQQYKAILRSTTGQVLDVSKYDVEWSWKSNVTYPQLYVYQGEDYTTIKSFDKDYSHLNENGNLAHTSFTTCGGIAEREYDGITKTVILTDAGNPKYYVEDRDYIALQQTEDQEPSKIQLYLEKPFRSDYICNSAGISDTKIHEAIRHTWRHYEASGEDYDPEPQSPYFNPTQIEYYYVSCNTAFRCKSREASAPNNHILKATCRIPVVFDGQTKGEQTRTLVAYYPIAVYHPTIGFESADGVFQLSWNERNELIAPTINNDYTIGNVGYSVTPAVDQPEWTLCIKNNTDFPLELINSTTNNSQLRIANEQKTLGLFNDIAIITCNETQWGLIYQIPLLTQINTYSTNATNKWSGAGIYTDEGEGIILTAQIGAGHLNSSTGQFTGIMMGDVELTNNIQSGLYGFKDGQMTFGLDAGTGDAFFKGHIEALSGNIGGWDITEIGFEAEKKDFLLYTYPQEIPISDYAVFSSYKERGGKGMFAIGQPPSDPDHGYNFIIDGQGFLYCLYGYFYQLTGQYLALPEVASNKTTGLQFGNKIVYIDNTGHLYVDID